jgi:malate dehydrogenase (oxaloacetate-decarboxylating)(NADP+)
MPDQSPEMPDPDQPGTQQSDDFRQAALDYHRLAPAGKIKVTATKPMVTQRELARA